MNPLALLLWLPVLGVIAGLGSARFRRLPLVAAALVLAAYVLYVIATASWSAICWDCHAGADETRRDALIVGSALFGALAASTLAGIWLGARLTGVLQRLFRTASELRQGGPAQPK